MEQKYLAKDSANIVDANSGFKYALWETSDFNDMNFRYQVMILKTNWIEN